MSSEKRKLRRAKEAKGRAQLALDIEAYLPQPHDDRVDALGALGTIEFKTGGSPTGRLHSHQADAYRMMLQGMNAQHMMNRQAGKMTNLAAGYGMSKSAFQGINFKSDPFGLGVDPANLTVDEWRWAVAFKQVLEVDPAFYAEAPYVRRRQLEQHYETIAKNDSPKGRKAAKVISIRVQLILDEKAPYRFDMQGKNRAAAFAQSQSWIIGRTASSAIIDDLLP